MKQAGENSNSLKMVFRNRPENEKIVRTTAAVFASVLDPTLEEISDFKTDLYYQNPEYLEWSYREGKLLD